METIGVKCSHCGRWMWLVVETKLREQTRSEAEAWEKAAGEGKRL